MLSLSRTCDNLYCSAISRFFCLFALLGLILPFMTACSHKIPHSQTFQSGRLVYQVGSTAPFTGIVTGKAREGYRRQLCTYEKSYKDGRLHGFARYWYPNGQLESAVPYVHGEMNGMVSRYYPDGQIKARIHFVNGMRGGSKGESFWGPDGERR
jgi:hypothetical protein